MGLASRPRTLRDGGALSRASFTGWRWALTVMPDAGLRVSLGALGAMARRDGLARNGGSGRSNTVASLKTSNASPTRGDVAPRNQRRQWQGVFAHRPSAPEYTLSNRRASAADAKKCSKIADRPMRWPASACRDAFRRPRNGRRVPAALAISVPLRGGTTGKMSASEVMVGRFSTGQVPFDALRR